MMQTVAVFKENGIDVQKLQVCGKLINIVLFTDPLPIGNYESVTANQEDPR